MPLSSGFFFAWELAGRCSQSSSTGVGMGLGVAVILGMIGFALMSRPFKIVAILGVLFVGVILLNLKLGVRLLPREVMYWLAGVFEGVQGFKLGMALFNSYMGLIGLGVLLGIIRRVSSTPERYADRRKALLIFLIKWGGLFLAFRVVVEWLLELGVVDKGMGWVVTRAYSMPVFIAFVVLVVLFKWITRKSKGADQDQHVSDKKQSSGQPAE